MVIFSCLYGSTFSSDDDEELDDPFGTLGLPLSEPPGSPPLSELFEDSDDDELFLDEGLDDGGFPNECDKVEVLEEVQNYSPAVSVIHVKLPRKPSFGGRAPAVSFFAESEQLIEDWLLR